MKILCCVLTSLLSLSSTSPHSFRYGRFLPASSRSLFSFRSARDRIKSSSRNNYVSYWHFKGQPVNNRPSAPAAPTYTTNTRTNNIDPGLVSTTAPIAVNPSDWVAVVPSKLASPPRQVASLRWPRFSPGPGDTMLTGQMKDRPSVKWSANTGDLFTVMILDEGIASLNGQQYAHWVVTNVPGNIN